MKFITFLVMSGIPAFGATVFSTSSTSRVDPTDSFAAVNDSFTYFIGVVGDSGTTWSLSGENNNSTNVQGPRARLTLTQFSGTGSLSLAAPGSSNSFNLVTDGTVNSFTFRLEYINQAGDSLGMSGRAANSPSFGPMNHVLLQTNPEAQSVEFSMLDGSNNVIDPGGFTPISDDVNGYAAKGDPNPTYNLGVYGFDLADQNDIGNILSFDDATPGDTSDDFFAGLTFAMAADDGEFASGTAWRMSFDSQILQETFPVPEPSSTLFAAAGSLFLLRRNRRR